MIKKAFFTALSILMLQVGMACDACGCRLGGLSYGILPQHYKHLIGLRYSHAAFKAEMNHDSEFFSDEYSKDSYQQVDILARASISDRIQLNFQVPYLFNTMDGSHQSVKFSGLGDPSILVFFTPFNSGETEKLWKQSLRLGAGLKLPLGKHQQKENGEIINRNFQLGSGSLDYLATMNYTTSLNDWGLNVESSYKFNTANKQDYRFGNQFNFSSYFFRYLETGNVGFLPFGGLYFEKSGHHKDGEIKELNSGGSATFATIGTQTYWQAWSLNLEYQKPIRQDYNSDNVAHIQANSRFMVSLLMSL